MLAVEVRELPDVDRPIVSVRVNYPGASPETMDAEVMSLLEGAVARLSGIQNISSASEENDGRMRVERANVTERSRNRHGFTFELLVNERGVAREGGDGRGHVIHRHGGLGACSAHVVVGHGGRSGVTEIDGDGEPRLGGEGGGESGPGGDLGDRWFVDRPGEGWRPARPVLKF